MESELKLVEALVAKQLGPDYEPRIRQAVLRRGPASDEEIAKIVTLVVCELGFTQLTADAIDDPNLALALDRDGRLAVGIACNFDDEPDETN